jgi:hypothetical protein
MEHGKFVFSEEFSQLMRKFFSNYQEKYISFTFEEQFT